MILTIRTDNPMAEVGFYSSSGAMLSYKKWQAHRELSSTVLRIISNMLHDQGSTWNSIEGIIYYAGPGSFTGLRIGASLVNALAYTSSVPVVSVNGDNWINEGLSSLKTTSGRIAVPLYGSPANTTAPKK